jgi:hypothetical protein
MGWRFSKRVRLAKGVTLNLSKSGCSLSLGTRGAKINISKRGVRGTAPMVSAVPPERTSTTARDKGNVMLVHRSIALTTALLVAMVSIASCGTPHRPMATASRPPTGQVQVYTPAQPQQPWTPNYAPAPQQPAAQEEPDPDGRISADAGTTSEDRVAANQRMIDDANAAQARRDADRAEAEEAARLANAAAQAAAEEERSRIKLSQFADVQEGMTYDQVELVIGSVGTVQAHSFSPGTPGITDDLEFQIVAWANPDGSNMNVTFRNGIAIAKAQAGLR